jgi:hypothetical protein
MNVQICKINSHYGVEYCKDCIYSTEVSGGASRKVEGLIPDGFIGIFHGLNPSGLSMDLGSIDCLRKMSTRNISWGVKPYHLRVPIVCKFWEPQPSGALRACSSNVVG